MIQAGYRPAAAIFGDFRTMFSQKAAPFEAQCGGIEEKTARIESMGLQPVIT
jgi:hypothetical protein